jgi:hypothetical protein
VGGAKTFINTHFSQDDYRVDTHCCILAAQSVAHPEQPLDLAYFMNDDLLNTIDFGIIIRNRDICLYAITIEQAITNPEHALESANLIHFANIKAQAFCDVASAQASTNRPLANDLFFQALGMASILDGSHSEHYKLFGYIVRAILATR